MAHNPIIKQQTISRTDLGFNVPLGAVGVFYQGQRFIRLLQPGEMPSLNERLNLGGLMVYLVDTGPHDMNWRVNLPAKGDKDTFVTTVTVKYQVADPQKMAEARVTDTETHFTKSLEPLLRKIGREHPFNHHRAADTALETAIAQADWPTLCGLRLVDPPAVVINLTAEDLRRVKQLDDLERAMRVARPARHTDDLPSAEPGYKFRVTVNLKYKVQKPEELPFDSLEEVEQELWPAVRTALRHASRKYKLLQVDQADQDMQLALEDLVEGKGLQEFGLKVLGAEIDVDFDAASGKRFGELVEIEHSKALEIAKLRGLPFYFELAQQGEWAVLAVAAAKGEINLKEFAARLSDRDRENLETKIKLLAQHRPDNFASEVEGIELLRNVSEGITDSLGRPKNVAVPAYDAGAKALPDGKGKSEQPPEGEPEA